MSWNVSANHLKAYRALIKEKELILKRDRNAVPLFEPYLVRTNYGYYYIDAKLELLSRMHDRFDKHDSDDEVRTNLDEFEKTAKRFFPDLTLEQVMGLMVEWQWEQKQDGWKDAEDGIDD
jgi:hypothetical protein